MPLKSNSLSWRSLQTRLTLLTLAIFLASAWLLTFFASRMLQADMQGQMEAQQFSTVSVVASQIEHELDMRLRALERVGARVNLSASGSRAGMQARLDEHVILQSLFNGGVFLVGADGRVMAPGQAGWTGDTPTQEDVLAALTEGKATIGRPHFAGPNKNPEFGMTVPVRDAQGNVIGALRGTVNLSLPNFLDQIKDSRYGRTGRYLLVSRPDRLVITSTSRKRLLDPAPEAGVNPQIDRFIQGFEGSAIFVDPFKVETLTSAKGIAGANWYVAAVLPTAEAFAPIHALQQRLLLATVLLTLLAGGLIRWMLRRQLAPLRTMAATLATLAGTDEFPAALPVQRPDEVGHLVAGFNHLLESLRQRDILLGQVLDNSSVGIFLVDMQGRITRANQRMAEIFGIPVEQLTGSEYVRLIHPSQRESARQLMLRLIARTAQSTDVELLYWRPDQSEFWGHFTGSRFDDSKGHNLGAVGMIEDITDRKLAQTRMAESEERFRTLIEESPAAIAVHRNGKLLYGNPAAIGLIGASSAQELVGQPLLDRVHPDCRQAVLARLQRSLRVGSVTPMLEEKFLKLDGTCIDVEVQNSAIVYDGVPAIRVAFRDISERKLANDKLRLAASVFTHACEGIIITDAKGNIVDANESFSHITGYSRSEALGQNPSMLKSDRQSCGFYAAMWLSLGETDHWHGEIWNQRKSGEVYPEMLTISAVRDKDGRVQHYVALFSDITPIKAHQHELEHIAHFDALTNLPNRVLLADRLEQGMLQAQRRGQILALAYLDLDGFKAINDRHGHEAGDLLLKTVATRMKQTLREGDTLARIGGDEFVAVLLDLTDAQASVPMLQRLLAAAAEPVQLGELVLQVSASLGVTFYPQLDGVEADQMLRQADQAMYQAKLAGKNRYHLFDVEQDRSVRGQHESIERIRQALVADEFVLHYQPKVNMRSGAVIGAEALIRWQHPEKDLLHPAAFLPVIEDDPLAVAIGEWVIATALTQIELWQAVGLDLPVSVNVGARQLQQIDFVPRLRRLLAAHPKVKPHHLEIEVLETSALEDLAGVAQVIEECHQLGVRFAMDDFGTGYSSLTYLKRLRVTLLKIDQSFVRDMLEDPDDLAILEGVIGLAGAFRRDVIAEGVETIEHGTLLLQLGCDLAQGFGIARPMVAELFPAWAGAWQRDAAWIAISEA